MVDESTTTSRFVTLIVAGSVVAGTVLGSVGGTVVALSVSATVSATADSGSPSDAPPSDPATASGAPVAEPTTAAASPTPVSDPALGHPVPTSCGDLYSAGMLSTLSAAGVALNPSWIYGSGGYTQVGTRVAALQPILDTPAKLTCTWTTPGSGSEVGLTTEIVQVKPAQTTQISDTLTSIGWTRLDELGGVRFVVQRNLEGNSVGESQFLRDGLWFSTQYVNLGVKGYTADMVTQVFG